MWPLPDRRQCALSEGDCKVQRQKPLIQFTMCGGVDKMIGGTVNQFYSLLNGLALAYSLHADVILPDLAKRDTFGKNVTEIQWSNLPLSTLYDVHHLKSYWAQRSMTVFTHQDAMTLNRSVTRILAPRYLMDRNISYWKSLFSMDLDPCGTTLLQFDCVLFAVRTETSMPLIQEVLPSLKFRNPQVQSAVQRIVRFIQLRHDRYDALHLRVEADTSVWKVPLELQLESALSTCETAGFSAPVYVASGIFGTKQEDKGQIDVEEVLALLGDRFDGQIYHKGMIISAAELAAMNSEELALLDILVCIEATRFVGYGESSFSFFIGEQRKMRQAVSLSSSKEFSTHYYGYMGRVFLTAGVLSKHGQTRAALVYKFDP